MTTLPLIDVTLTPDRAEPAAGFDHPVMAFVRCLPGLVAGLQR